MKTKTLVLLTLGALAVGLTASVITMVELDRGHTAEHKLQQFCTGVTDAMRQDEGAFLGSDVPSRERAYARFYEGDVMYHSAQSVMYCLDEIPDMPLGCQMNKDWPCLARIAHQIRQSLQER